MATAYKSQGAGVSTATSGAALTPLCPATVDAGDILLAHAAYNDTSTTPDTPSGWTLLTGPHNIGTTPNGRHWVFGKIADGSEDGASVAFGTAGGTTKRWARVYSYSGRVAGTITELVRGFANTAHATDPQMPSVTTTIANSLAAAFTAQNDDNAVASATGESGGDWVESVAEYTATTGTGVMMHAQHATMAAVGTISGGSCATTNDPCGVIAMEVRPEVASITITGAVMDVTPDFPVAKLQHRLTAATLDVTPDFPVATLRHRLTATTLDAAPEFPVAGVSVPTIDFADGYEHREFGIRAINRFGGAGDTGLYTSWVNGSGFANVDGLDGGRALRLPMLANTAHRLTRDVGPASAHRVGSIYVKVVSLPVGNSNLVMDMEHSPNGMSWRLTPAGVIELWINTGSAGPNINDGEWHLLDWYLNSSANPWVLKGMVDGVPLTDVTFAQTPSTPSVSIFAPGNGGFTTLPAMTVDLDHAVISSVPADYPIGPHRVRALFPNGDGTHSFTPAGDFLKTATSMNPADTDAWLQVDDWITDVVGEADYIADALGASNEYVEITFDDTTENTIWQADAVAALFSADTLANEATARIVDAGGATVADIYSGDMSETAVHFRKTTLFKAPTFVTPAAMNGYKLRFGFATDVDPDPRLIAAMIEFVVPAPHRIFGKTLDVTPDFPVATLRHRLPGVTLDVTPDFPQASINAGPITITGVVLDVTPTLDVATLRHRLTAATLDVTPSLETATLRHRLTATVLDVTPTLETATLRHRLTATTLDVTPDFPAGRLNLQGVTLDVAPTFPAGSISQVGQVGGVTLDVTPTLEVATLRHRLTGVVLDVAPTFPVGALQHRITGVVLDVTPALPQAALRVQLVGTVLDVIPTFPQAGILPIRAVTLDILVDFPAGSVSIVIPQVHPEMVVNPIRGSGPIVRRLGPARPYPDWRRRRRR